MKEQFITLLNTLYEAEGLVEMAIRRNVNPDDRVTRLALDKCLLLGQLASEIQLPELPADTPDNTPVPLYAEEVDEPSPEPECEIEEKEVSIFTEEVLPNVQHEEADINDASIFHTEEEAEAKEEEENGEKTPVTPTATHKECMAATTARKPLMGCFSINDKFRFRKELFGGSDTSFHNTLDNLQHLDTLSEACNYLFVSHDWDPDDETVKAFISRIEIYFR